MPEANIEAECYHQLRLLGIKSYLQYRTYTKEGETCIFDMIILKETDNKAYEIIAIVEFKNHSKHYDYKNTSATRQYKKYSSFNLPLIYCHRREEIQETVDKIVQLYNEYQPSPIS